MIYPIRPLVVVPVALFLSACEGMEMGDMDHDGTVSAVPEILQVEATAAPSESGPAPDLDPDPATVEVSLEAKVSEVEIAPGRRVALWTYNDQFPGPRIEAQVGDTVRVRFKNSLPEATTIHWHGVRVPAAMDGAMTAQTPIEPGDEFTYEFVVPDGGTFWYHPHVRSDEQVERGLYGAFVVHGNAEPETTSDHTIVLDDILIDSAWTLEAFDPMQAMIGRQGNLILANGWAHPIVQVERGGLHRFRFINAANARYFNLALPGHRLIQIGTDGGFLEQPRDLDNILLVPGERVELLVVADGDGGASSEWTGLAYDRGHGTGGEPAAAIFRMLLSEDPAIPTPSIPESFSGIPELPEPTLTRELKLEESMGMPDSPHAGHGAPTESDTGPVFSINGETFPEVTPLVGELGTVEEWSIVNTTEMDHPFHLHGFRFQVTSWDGDVPRYRAWRDSINIPANNTVKFRVRLEDNPGMWMFHCHILEHAERGMAGELEVMTAPPN